MRNRMLTYAVCGLLANAATAQDSYDAQNFMNKDLNGTARFVAMGGALGALGGDLSVMSTNPAGTAMYRRNDIALSLGGLFSGKGALGHDGARMSVDQAGVVIVYDMEEPTSSGVQFVNFGANFQKHRNFLFNQDTYIDLGGNKSQTFQIADLGNEAYWNDYFGTLTDMSAHNYGPENAHGGILAEDWYDEDGNPTQDPWYVGVPATDAVFQRAAFGSNLQTDVNLSLNVADRYFFGASVGVYDMDYTNETMYCEWGTDGNYYDFTNWYRTKAEGFDVKLGFICRPIPESPLRFGLALHTPVWYRMTDSNGSVLYLNDEFVDNQANSEYDYNFRTPWKLGCSIGYTVGDFFAIGAEYEYQDLSTAKYEGVENMESDYFRNQNRIIDLTLRGQHTWKFGLEYKPVDAFALRFGFNHVSSPFRKDAFRTIGYDSVYTDTSFCNWGDTNRFTCGLGFRFKGGYADLTYQYQQQEGDFYAFDDVNLTPERVKANRSQLLGTIGFRF